MLHLEFKERYGCEYGTYSSGLLTGIAGGLLHGHGVRVPGGLLGARFLLLLRGLEETEEAVLEHGDGW